MLGKGVEMKKGDGGEVMGEVKKGGKCGGRVYVGREGEGEGVGVLVLVVLVVWGGGRGVFEKGLVGGGEVEEGDGGGEGEEGWGRGW